MISKLKKFLIVIVLSIAIIPTVHAEHAWDSSDIKIENIKIEENNIVGFDISFKLPINKMAATGWIGIQTEEFSYDTPSIAGDYGDFTDWGNINTTYHFSDINAVKNNIDFMNQYGIIGFAPDSNEGFPCFYNIIDIKQTVTISNVPIFEQKTYSVYMWTNNGSFYPDAYLGKIELDGTGNIEVFDSTDTDGVVVAKKVTFNTNGGSEINPQIVNTGKKAVRPDTNPTRDNYVFDNWYADELLTTLFDFDNTVINEDTEIYAKWNELGDYEFISGENQTYVIGASNPLVFEIGADYSLFENGGKVYVDDNLINSYTSKSGSTIIKLGKTYMDSLSVGSHKIKIVFNNNRKAVTTFKVSKVDNPNTGDNIVTNIVLLMLSLIGFVSVIIYTKKKVFN